MNIDELLSYIDKNPGVKFGVMRESLAHGKDFRILDRALQKLRKQGKVEFRGGGWYVK